MTRIVAGFAGAMTLAVPRAGTRPTSERVREAVFSALEARGAIAGCRVLDLFAGSGALGLEAASRGAAEVALVERDREAAEVCHRNIAALLKRKPPNTALEVRVITKSVGSYLETAPAGWDLVFIDPPYDLSEPALARVLAALTTLLNKDAVIVIERSSRSVVPAPAVGWQLERTRNYGETAIHTYTLES